MSALITGIITYLAGDVLGVLLAKWGVAGFALRVARRAGKRITRRRSRADPDED